MSAKTSVNIDIEVKVEEAGFCYSLFSALRQQGLLHFDDKHDDHPSFQMTSPIFRSKFLTAVKRVIRELPITVEADT